MSERDYTYDLKYQKSKRQVARRVKRNAARRRLMKQGRVHKGDNRDIDHSDGNALNNSPKNLRVVSRSYNRSKK